MKTVILEAFRDPSTGELGLGVSGMPRNDDTNAAHDGLTIAHDLIEHVNGVREIGSITDELEALGAVWFVRGQFNDLRRDGRGSMYSVHENIASDLVRMFRDFFYGALVDLKVPRTRSCVADDDLREIVQLALNDAPAELHDDDDPQLAVSRLADYIAVCLPRMRIGYRKAQRKYKKAIAANRLFWRIAESVERYANRPEYEGAQYKLVYGFDKQGNACAWCEEFYGDEY